MPSGHCEINLSIPEQFYAYCEFIADRQGKSVDQFLSDELQSRLFDELVDISGLDLMNTFFPGLAKEGRTFHDKVQEKKEEERRPE